MAKDKPDQTVQSTLAEAAANFAAMITAQGYCTHTVDSYARNARRFAAKLECSGVTLIKLDDQTAEELISQITTQICASGRSYVKHQLERFRDYLIGEHGAPPREPEPIDTSPRAVLKRDYEPCLRVQRGLSEETIYHCLRFFDRFLTAKFGAGLGDLNNIKPDDITGFILRLREKQNAPRDKTGPSHLRNLFQFLFWSGKTTRNLSSAVPKARQPKPTGIPRYLEPEEVNRLIEVVRDHKKTGRRNQGIAGRATTSRRSAGTSAFGHSKPSTATGMDHASMICGTHLLFTPSWTGSGMDGTLRLKCTSSARISAIPSQSTRSGTSRPYPS